MAQTLLVIAQSVHLIFAEGWRLVSCASHRIDTSLTRRLLSRVLDKVLLEALYLTYRCTMLQTVLFIVLRVLIEL